MNRVICTVAILGLVVGLAGTAQAEFMFDVEAAAYDIGAATVGAYSALDDTPATSPASVTHNSITYNFSSGRTSPLYVIGAGVSGSVAVQLNAYERNFNPGPGGQGWDSFATLENINVDWVFPSVNNIGAVDSVSTNLSPFQVGYTLTPGVAFPVGIHYGFLAISHNSAFNNPLYRDLSAPNGTSDGIAGPDYTQTTNFPLTIQVLAPPVPEPASILVWSGLGLTIAGARWYRRRKAAK